MNRPSRSPRPNRALRLAAAGTVLALTTTACGLVRGVTEEAGDRLGDVISEIPVDGGADGTGASGQESSASTGGDTGTGTGDAGATTGAPATSFDDAGRVGANGRAMLRGDIANLIVEVDVASGATAPSQTALDHLGATLRSIVDKPGGVTFAGGNTFPDERTQWTTSDLAAAAASNRSNRSSGDTVVMYVLYVGGSFVSNGEETSAIGVTYNASEFAVFSDKYQGFGALLGSTSSVERAVLVHELGHVLGLVNLTYTSEIAHEDAENPGHSNSQSSVMYWAIETTFIQQVFSGAPPDRFDDADLADIAGLKSGKY